VTWDAGTKALWIPEFQEDGILLLGWFQHRKCDLELWNRKPEFWKAGLLDFPRETNFLWAPKFFQNS